MTNLSPAAQAVLDALDDQFYKLNSQHMAAAVAALRYAADTLLDHKYWNGNVTGWDNKPAIFYRKKLFAIADELESQ
jgi:hypothetical protein